MLTYQINNICASTKQTEAKNAPGIIYSELTLVLGSHLYTDNMDKNINIGETKFDNIDHNVLRGNSWLGLTAFIISRINSINGAVNNKISIKKPAPKTKPMSIMRSFKKGLGTVIPHAVLIPLRIAPNTADEAQTRPKKLIVPVIVLASNIPFKFILINSPDTGMILAMLLTSTT